MSNILEEKILQVKNKKALVAHIKNTSPEQYAKIEDFANDHVVQNKAKIKHNIVLGPWQKQESDIFLYEEFNSKCDKAKNWFMLTNLSEQNAQKQDQKSKMKSKNISNI